MIVKNKNLGKLCATLLSLVIFVGCGGGGTGTKDISGNNSSTQISYLPTLQSQVLNSGQTFGTNTWADGSTEKGGHGQALGNIGCLVNENYHVHSHLTIIQNGVILAIPKNIGLQGCAYEVHTHDSSGVIHVETQAYHKITLGDFFSVWGFDLSRNSVAGLNDSQINFFIVDRGVIENFQGDPADIELTSHKEITIVIGKIPSQIPTFIWPNDL